MYVCVWLICHFTPMEAALTAAQGRVQSSGDPQTLEAPTPPSEKKYYVSGENAAIRILFHWDWELLPCIFKGTRDR